MIRAYALTDTTFLPIDYECDKPTIYVSHDLYLALYRAPASKLQEANTIFTAELRTSDYQLVCLVGDDTSQSVSDFELRDIVIDVPVSKVFKVD